jgi:glycosyltransferase involved in cell wall biosynthesis
MRKIKVKDTDKIFVQIASYRDPQLIPTINDALERALHPERLVFGICWQYDETEDPNHYDGNPQFRVSKHHYSESQGLGWARNITNQLLEDEKYTLQLDSHHRFLMGWDRMMVEDYEQASTMSKKPILSTYVTPFEVDKIEQCRCHLNKTPCLMSQYEFSPDKLLMSMPWYIQDYKERDTVIKARTLSGHFYFTKSEFIKEVPYDPDIYFGGYCEETTMSVRAWTSGYDFFSPYRQYIWHEYTRQGRPKHWEDHGTKSETEKTSGQRDVYARQKTRQIFGQEDNGIDLGIYGLGNVRTLHDYEVFGGFDFKNCRIQDYTLQVKEPANPTPWEEQFKSINFNLICDWDKEFFKEQQFEKPKFLTLGLLTKTGEEVYRRDFTMEEEPDYVNLKITQFNAVGRAVEAPTTLVMYLYDEEKQWSNRYEKAI